jgi:hypothetical protein
MEAISCCFCHTLTESAYMRNLLFFLKKAFPSAREKASSFKAYNCRCFFNMRVIAKSYTCAICWQALLAGRNESQKTIAEALGLNEMPISRLMIPLESHGYIKRRRVEHGE